MPVPLFAPYSPLDPRADDCYLFFTGMAKKNSRLQRIKQEALALWDESFHPDEDLTRLRRFLHFWVLVVKSFNRNRCPIRASALSFLTVLALVPVLAVSIGVASSLLKKQGEEQIYRFVDNVVSRIMPPASVTNSVPTQESSTTNQPAESLETNSSAASPTDTTNRPEPIINTNDFVAESDTNNESPGVADSTNGKASTRSESGARMDTQKQVAKYIHEFIRNTRSGTLSAMGAILLVLVGIRMLGSIESTFNDIWGVTRGRNWLSRIQIYCTGIVFGPLLLGGAAALTSGPHLKATQKFITNMPVFGHIIFPTLTLLVIWLTFTLFYQFVPKTKVRFRAALVGAIVSGTVWHLNNLFGFLYVSRVVSNSKIYGSLGLVPVFMAGVYFSWYILLFGAQIAYAFQNRRLYLQERIAENVNQRGREFVALRLMTCIGQRFQRGLPAPSSHEMSEELSIPSRLVQQVLQTLIAAHLATEVSGVEPAYTPGRPLEQITAHHILQAMRARGQELLTRNEPVREEVYGEFARIQEAEKNAASSITMLALVHRADARLELTPPPSKETEALPELVHATKPPSGPNATPKQAIDISETDIAAKPEPPVSATIPEPTPKPPESITSAHSVVEPIADEERDFPL
jgi:membrane protein